MKPLTPTQKRILDFIRSFQQRNGSTPTLREMADWMGCASQNNIRQHLILMERKGWIRRRPGKSRGNIPSGTVPENESPSGLPKDSEAVSPTLAPIVGAIAAGTPITAVENVESNVALDPALFKGDGLFCLRVKGDSMNNAGILDGDLAVIRSQSSVESGAIAAVLLDGEEATLKKVIREKNRLVLQAANPAYPDIPVPPDRPVRTAGKLVGVIRTC